MILKVISAQDILFQGEVDSVTLPGTEGEFTVLRNHASLISTLEPGTVTYHNDGRSGEVQVNGGIVDVDNNVVSVCIY